MLERQKAGGGNSGVSTGASSQTTIETFLPVAGGPLALAFGLHIVAGQLAYSKFVGPVGSIGPSMRFAIWNGEGMGLGWEGPQAVTWAGHDLSASPDGSTPGYHFHPGTFAFDDPTNQGPDSFFTSPLHFNGTSYTGVLLPENLSVEQQPDKLRQVLKCLRIPQFNESGVWQDKGTATQYKYSTNPADVIAFGFWRAGLLNRVHWPSWWRFRQYCAEQITWNTGAGGEVQISRFEAHPVWTKAVSLNELCDIMGLITGMTWQDDGVHVHFILPNDLTPAFHFTPQNTVANSFKAVDVKLRERLNRLIIRFRDTRDIWLKPSSVVIEREALWTQYGEIQQEVSLPNMTHSQAQRIGQAIMRVATDYPNKCSIEAYGGAFKLLEGDCATATLAENGWRDQLVRVNSVVDISSLSRPDVRRFELQRLDGPLYSDTDHTEVQEEVEAE